MLQGLKGRKSLGKILFWTVLITSSVFAQGLVTNADAGFITGVSRAGGLTCLGNKQESITWDTQMGVVNRHRYAVSQHFNLVNGVWTSVHAPLHSGWVFGWTTGFAASHSERLSYPGVVGDHYTYFPIRGVVYHGRTVTVNTCDGQPKWFEYDDGSRK